MLVVLSSAVVTGTASPATVTEALYFMTEDVPSRGLNQDNWTGIAYNSVTQPTTSEPSSQRWTASLEVLALFDNPQFWSTPNEPSDPSADPPADDVVVLPAVPLRPSDDPGTTIVAYKRSVKKTPVQPEDYEMYNVTADPMELANLYNVAPFSGQGQALAQLLAQ